MTIHHERGEVLDRFISSEIEVERVLTDHLMHEAWRRWNQVFSFKEKGAPSMARLRESTTHELFSYKRAVSEFSVIEPESFYFLPDKRPELYLCRARPFPSFASWFGLVEDSALRPPRVSEVTVWSEDCAWSLMIDGGDGLGDTSALFSRLGSWVQSWPEE